MDNKYWHSVILKEERCTGCTICMQNCPTQAIRVIDGKAMIIPEKCIDCGRCINVCPYFAKAAATDPIDALDQFDYKVALPSIPFYAQFSVKYSKGQIHSAIRNLGFDEVFDTSYFAEVLSVHLKDIVESKTSPWPLISTYCPAVTRLIQIKNPELIPNIVRIESPMEVAARHVRKDIIEKLGIAPERIGIFLLAQCPAKITSIKSPIGIEKSALDGAFSIKDLFPQLLKFVIASEKSTETSSYRCRGELWGRIGGMSQTAGIQKSIKVDGIDEVSKILDMIELGKLDELDFIESYSCIGGCVGGPLNIENPFIAKYRIEKRSIDCDVPDEKKIREEYDPESLCWDKEIEASHIMRLDDNLGIALRKMEAINQILKRLPRIDCGACGSPSCRALAEDIVQHRAVMTDCIFVKLRSDEK